MRSLRGPVRCRAPCSTGNPSLWLCSLPPPRRFALDEPLETEVRALDLPHPAVRVVKDDAFDFVHEEIASDCVKGPRKGIPDDGGSMPQHRAFGPSWGRDPGTARNLRAQACRAS